MNFACSRTRKIHYTCSWKIVLLLLLVVVFVCARRFCSDGGVVRVGVGVKMLYFQLRNSLDKDEMVTNY